MGDGRGGPAGPCLYYTMKGKKSQSFLLIFSKENGAGGLGRRRSGHLTRFPLMNTARTRLSRLIG